MAIRQRQSPDARLFTKGVAFAQLPKPNIILESSEGPSGSQLQVDLSADGVGRFLSLSWPAAPPESKELLLLSEDPDAPLLSPIIHGIYYGIPASVAGVSNDDFLESAVAHALKGGFKYGKNRRGNIYIPPRPLLGHGSHRYFFTLVALGQPLDVSKLSQVPTDQEIATAIEGNVVGWGEWVGVYERKWE
ncbi:hypothetical protein N7532_004458 [Penicillium argentinense]|uniref:PEBP-like protein n=1 Tax=Penicillium argentinense TaxID=1131581 RepID=A0A9W9FPE1_9EURO|nr:uncharacterized protein N7532_004458 [Penicillium argentinense]KAJ5103929.1 hypothetical protein N7532_004458 [Penicillium argentinense]